jgi:hypothetical protein
VKETTRKTKTEVVNNIKMDLAEVEFGAEDWTGISQDRYKWRALVNVVINLRIL